MASVAEMKATLAAETEAAVAVSDKAIATVDTVLNIAIFSLTIFAILLAILAIWSVREITSGAKRKAEQVANRKINDYLSGDEFKATVQREVLQAVEEFRRDQLARTVEEATETGGEEDEFPRPPEGRA